MTTQYGAATSGAVPPMNSSAEQQRTTGSDDSAEIESWISLCIGGVLFFFFFILHFIHRFFFNGNQDGYILCAIYFLFCLGTLAGFQHNYKTTFINVMIIVPTIWFLVSIVGTLLCQDYKSRRQHRQRLQSHWIRPCNLYEDIIMKPIDKVLPVCGVKIKLLVFYVLGLYKENELNFDDIRTCVFYWAGVFVISCIILMQCSFQDFMRLPKFWSGIFTTLKQNGSIDGYDIQLITQRIKLYIRFVVDLLINRSGTLIVLLGLPIHVATSRSPLEFVKNVATLKYIYEMNNRTDSRAINIRIPYRQEQQDQQPAEQQCDEQEAVLPFGLSLLLSSPFVGGSRREMTLSRAVEFGNCSDTSNTTSIISQPQSKWASRCGDSHANDAEKEKNPTPKDIEAQLP